MFPHNFCAETFQPNVYTGLSIPLYSQKNVNEPPIVCDSVPKKRVRPVSNAARERSRVKTLRSAFLDLQETLPSVPPDTKLSKLDVLILATTYITHLMKTLDSADQVNNNDDDTSSVPVFHPVKKWPMRTRLYDGILDSTKPVRDNKRRKTCAVKSLLPSQSQPLNCGLSSDELMP